MIQDHRFLGGAARAANRWSDFLETEGFTIQRMAGDQAIGKGRVLTGKPARGWARLSSILLIEGVREKQKWISAWKTCSRKKSPI